MTKSSKREFYRHFHVPMISKKVGSLTAKIEVDFETLTATASFARCNKEDNFCRKTGRELADKARKITFSWHPDSPAFENLFAGIYNCLADLPQPAKSKWTAELENIIKVLKVYLYYRYSLEEDSELERSLTDLTLWLK